MSKGQGTAFAILCIVILVAIIGLVFVLNSEPTITGRGHDPSIVLPQPGETDEEYFQRYEFQRATLQHTRPRRGPYKVYPAVDPPGYVTSVSQGSMIDNRDFHYDPLLQARAEYYKRWYDRIER